MNTIMEDAEPFAFTGSDIGILVLHGFTGTPQSVREVGEQLHRQYGFSIAGARLAGHGTSPEDMCTTGYRDWLKSAESALDDLRAHCQKTFVLGLSMGGSIALNLAAQFPEKVDGIATIGAPVGALIDTFADTLCRDPLPQYVASVGSDIKADGVIELAYAEVPTKCINELMAFVWLTRSRLPSVKCPMIVMHSREDHVVLPVNAIEITNNAGSNDIRLLWLDNSYHVATLDNDKDLIIKRAGTFFNEIADRPLD